MYRKHLNSKARVYRVPNTILDRVREHSKKTGLTQHKLINLAIARGLPLVEAELRERENA
jgi:hypothetical protein